MPEPVNTHVPIVKRTHLIDAGRGIRIHTVEKRADGAGPVVLLLHGLGVGSLYWDLPVREYSTMDYLVSRGLRVYAIDHRGYGESSSVSGDSVRGDNAVSDVSAVIDFIKKQAGVERICLVGHSWGAMVATMVAAERKESLDSLVLIGLPYKRLNTAFQELLEPMRRAFVPMDGWIPNQTHLGLEQFLYSYDPEVLHTYQEIVSTVYPRIPLGILDDCASLPHVASIGNIECPTLTICGSLELVVDLLDSVSLLHDLNVPEKDLILVGNVGHLTALEKLTHARVDRLVADWAVDRSRSAK